MKKFICTALILILIPFISVQRVFADESNPDLPFTDVVIDQLVDITSSVNRNWIKVVTEQKMVYDEVLIETTQGQFATLTPNGNHIIFTGSYYDNSIVGLTGCNSSSYHYNTGTTTVDSTINIEPGLYGYFDSPVPGQDGIIYNFGISVNAGSSGTTSTTTSGFDNTTEACRIIGMDTGDGSVDGTVLLEMGYEKQTITYNDGSTHGHTATVYVPGDESISLSIDGSYISSIINNIVINFIQDAVWFYHKEYSIYLSANQGYYVPEYGLIKSYSYFNNIFNVNPNPANVTAQFDPSISAPGVTAGYNKIFNYHTGSVANQSNVYDKNDVTLSWQGTCAPYWKFVEPRQSIALSLNNPYIDTINATSNSSGLSLELYTIQSSDVSNYPDFTSGYKMPTNSGFSEYHFYKLQDSGRLGLFNQLGTFLDNWLTRIKSSIDSISGNSDIVQEIENDYNIDFDTSINNYIQNIQNTSQNIDLTAPQNNLPTNNHLSDFAPIVSETLKVFTDNNIWIFIFIPILIGILGLIL